MRDKKNAYILSVLTWNIHSCIGTDGVCDPYRVAHKLASLDYDFICLQEVGWHLRGTRGIDQFEILKKEFCGYDYISLTKTRNAHFGNLILSRHPILNTETVDLGRWWTIPRVLQDITVNYSGMNVHILNTHLGLDPFERYSQLNIIYNHIKKIYSNNIGNSIILCGDFNTIATGAMVKKLSSLFNISESRRTFPSQHPILNLDRIFASNVTSCLDISKLNHQDYVLMSDHLPIQAIFEV